MPARAETDVAVVGGGPAGAAAALTLRRYTSLRVVMLERSCYDHFRIGETVSPALQPLLDYLGVWDAFVRQDHASAHGTAAAWGSAALEWHSFLLSGQGEGWHLDRSRFDRMLAQAVAERGGSVFEGISVVGIRRDPNEGSWRILARRRNGSERELSAGFLIDATGSRASVAARLGARQRFDDRLVAVVARAHLSQGVVLPPYTTIESARNGWWYAAPQPSGGIVAAFLTDAAVVRERRLREPASWSAELTNTQHIRRVLDRGRILTPLRVLRVHSSLVQPVCGPGWLAVGDAAASFDPLSSMGVGHALSSGIHAARAVDSFLAGKRGLLDEYAENVEENFRKYLGLRYRFYRQERRWPDHPFWAARHRMAATLKL